MTPKTRSTTQHTFASIRDGPTALFSTCLLDQLCRLRLQAPWEFFCSNVPHTQLDSFFTMRSKTAHTRARANSLREVTRFVRPHFGHSLSQNLFRFQSRCYYLEVHGLTQAFENVLTHFALNSLLSPLQKDYIRLT